MGGSVVRIVYFFLLSAAFVLPVAACGGEPGDAEEYLEFNSGGRYHPSGYGEWRIRLNGDGSVVAIHDVGDRTESTDTFVPTKTETRKLFSLFCALDIKRMKSSDRPGVPDEVKYSFGLKDGSGNYSKSMWINDARENRAIQDLIGYLEVLVKKYTGKEPIMR